MQKEIKDRKITEEISFGTSMQILEEYPPFLIVLHRWDIQKIRDKKRTNELSQQGKNVIHIHGLVKNV